MTPFLRYRSQCFQLYLTPLISQTFDILKKESDGRVLFLSASDIKNKRGFIRRVKIKTFVVFYQNCALICILYFYIDLVHVDKYQDSFDPVTIFCPIQMSNLLLHKKIIDPLNLTRKTLAVGQPFVFVQRSIFHNVL